MNPKVWAPLGLLALGAAIVAVLVATRPAAERREETPYVPLVRSVRAAPGTVQLTVTAHGTVVPRTESELVAQVAGAVEWVSPSLAAGGFFGEGDPLVRIETADYEAALESARAAVARAQSEAERTRKERDRQRRLADQSVASQARIDDAESAWAQAAAALRDVRAQLLRAERDLERTTLTAPFDGRVRSENVDVGQFVNRGDRVATLYAVDYAEVRLPVPDRDLSFLDLSLSYRERLQEEEAGPPVVLRARFAGQEHEWRGRIVRTEGELDPKSRMVHVVARVDDPYGRESEGGDGNGPAPLAVGLFVEAEILGRRVEGAFRIPRTALREDDRVLVIDDEDRLHFQEVEVLRLERESAVIADGLRAGQRVLVSPIAAPVEGMRVRVQDGDAGAAS